MEGKRLHLLKEEPQPNELDWYGNIALHHAVLNLNHELENVSNLIKSYPDGVKSKNQFGFYTVSMIMSFVMSKLGVSHCIALWIRRIVTMMS